VRRKSGAKWAAALGLAAVAAGAAGGFAPPGRAPAPRSAASDAVRAGAAPGTAPVPQAGAGPHRAFVFTRGIYSDGRGFRRGFRRGSWSVDYPKADEQFLTVLRRLVAIDAHDGENAVRLDDPGLRRYPFLYMLEVGYMQMTPEEVKGLREYLLAGGFLMVDDFWGTAEWYNFEMEIQRVLPEYPIVEVPLDHPLFHSVYNVDEVVQVPNVANARWGEQTWERDGFVPHVRGIFDEKGRLLVAINWNTDLGDAWEWAEQPYYPVNYSTYAFQVGVNTIIYAMSH
jgi:hypothetical protein